MRNKLIFNEFTLTDSSLRGGVQFNQCVNTGAELTFGTAAAAQLSFTINNENNDANKYMGLTFTYQVQQPNDLNFRTVGIFNVTNVVKNGKSATLTAFDNICKFDIYVDEWIESLIFPMTLAEFATSLCNYCGVGLASTLFPTNANATIYDNFTGSGITGRQVLQYIAQEAAGFAVCLASGEVSIRKYNPVAINLTSAEYVTASLAEFAAEPIDKVQVAVIDDDIGVVVGTGSNVLIVKNNPLLYTNTDAEIREYVTNIFNAVKGYTYTPLKVTLLEDYNINCGDIIKVNNITTMIMSKKQTATGVVLESVGAQFRTIQEDNINEELNALRGKTNRLTRTVEETVSELADAQGNISTLTQTVEGFDYRIVSAETNATEAINKATEAKLTADGYEIQIQNAVTSADTALTQATEAKITAEGFALQITESLNKSTTALNKATSVEATVNGLSISVSNGTNSSTLQLMAGDTVLSSNNITFTGMVTFNDLATSGRTVINGSNITTGTIKAELIDTTSLKFFKMYNQSGQTIAAAYSSDYLILGGDWGGSILPYVNVAASSEFNVGNNASSVSNKQVQFNMTNTSILSRGGTWNIGSISYPFGSMWIGDITLRNGSSTLGSFTSTQLYVTGSTSNLGTSTYRWSNAYIDRLYLTASYYLSMNSSGALLVNGSAPIITQLYQSSTNYITLNVSRQLIPYGTGSTYGAYIGNTSYPFYYGYFTNINIGAGTMTFGTTASRLCFFGASGATRQTVSSSATVAQLITALKAYGLIY